ncbi:MAG: hypothetical protein ACM3Q4_01530 [Acidobacteriota bacterium]
MTSFRLLFVLLLCAAAAIGQPRQAQKSGPVSSGIKGLAFIDYYYNVQNPVSAVEGTNAFDIRRINLGYEHTFTRTVGAYSEIEANNADLTSARKYSVFIKQAYVELRDVLPQMRIDLGLSPSPAVTTSERIWGYRMLQKLPLDYYGLSPTVDNGLSVKGKIDPYGVVGYHVMVGNGNGTLVETDKTKRFYGALTLAPADGLTLEGYADYENLGNERYRATFKALAGFEGEAFSIGLEGVYRINHHTLRPTYDESPYAVSVYGWFAASAPVRFVYRGDFFDPDQNASNAGRRQIEAIVGIDYMPSPTVHIVPNVMYTNYSMKASGVPDPSDAITVRLTAGIYFSSIR